MSKVISSLNTMYNIERAATTIYKAQAGSFRKDIIVYEKLTSATANEHEHANRLSARIKELEGNLSKLGWFFAFGGTMIGLGTRITGKKNMMKVDIWVERKAIKDYGAFLTRVDFDEKSADLIKKNIGDEQRHMENWSGILDRFNKKEE